MKNQEKQKSLVIEKLQSLTPMIQQLLFRNTTGYLTDKKIKHSNSGMVLAAKIALHCY